MKIYLLLSFFAMAGLYACKAKTQLTDIKNPPAPAPVKKEVISCISTDWSYDFIEIWSKECPNSNHLTLIFDHHPQAVKKDSAGRDVPMADLEEIGLFSLQANGLSILEYRGTVIGVLKNGEKLDTILELFSDGEMITNSYHKFLDGKEQRRSYSNRQDLLEKPVIYLYPTQETSVNVRVNLKGELTHTYPKYNPAQGWTVTAKPDGELRDEKTGKIYYNLFWEGKSAYNYDLSTGFVVKGEDVADFLDASLEKLGLNRREANEFITYWLPEMEQNKYNLVHFSTAEYVAQAPLEVTPKADTEIRIFMVYQPLDAPIDIAPQTLESPARKGFTLVEWGGTKQEKPEN
jgi:hypothetical protein